MNSYTITQLEEKTGLLRRTIHFYVKERLLPPPAGRGVGAKYDEEHLLRLGVICVLRNKLSLDGIREALKKMDVPAMRVFLSNAEAGRKEWDTESIGKLVGIEQSRPKNISFANLGASSDDTPGNLLSALPVRSAAIVDAWQRITVAEGVEINLSVNLTESSRRAVLEMAEALRVKLEGKENRP